MQGCFSSQNTLFPMHGLHVKKQRTRRTALLLVYSHRRQGFSRVNTLKFCPARPSASGLPPAMRLSFLLGTSLGGGAPKSMLHRLEEVCRTADCTCRQRLRSGCSLTFHVCVQACNTRKASPSA